MALKVAVSPFYGAPGWTDELSGITFEKSVNSGIAIYDLSNVPVEKLDGIRKAVRINALILVEGSLGEQVVKQEPKVEAPIEVVEEVPTDAVVVEAAEDEKEEVRKAAVKKK